MKLYLSVIGIAMALISLFNITFGVANVSYVISAVVVCTALQFVFDGIIAIIINKTPDRFFGVDNPRFEVTERERSLYIKLGVRHWSDKVWELGGLGGFSKKTIKEPNNPEYIEKYIIECNKGVVTHRLSYFVGFLVMLPLDGVTAYSIALPVALVNLFLNILPTIVLRHNTPMLHSVLARLRRKRTPEEKAYCEAESEEKIYS